MILTIALREVQEHLKSVKFLIVFMITMLLVIITTVISKDDYVRRSQDYQEAMAAEHDNIPVTIIRQPQVLSIFAQGYDRRLGSKIEVETYSLPSRLSGYMGKESLHGSWTASFSSIDFGFMMRVIMSLMVIFLVYATISGEREQGTLKLLLATNVSRAQVLAGKCLASLMVISIPVIMSLLVAVTILFFDGNVSLTADDAVRIAILGGVSLLYLSLFQMIGLWISIVFERSQVALMTLLQVWLVLVILYPVAAILATDKLFPLPSEEEISMINLEAIETLNNEVEELRNRMYANYETSGLDRELYPAYEDAVVRRTEAEYQAAMMLEQRFNAQANTAEMISMLSPAAVFDRVAQRLMKTDRYSYDRFMDSVRRFWVRHVEHRKMRHTSPETYTSTPEQPFEHEDENAFDSLGTVVLPSLILFLLNMLFFALAYTTFIRKRIC